MMKHLPFRLTEVYLFGIILFIYSAIILSTIQWGIPGTSNPFPNNMDEYTQFKSITSLAHNFTNNLPGAARGPLFFYVLGGIYLAFFTLLQIIHPWALTPPFTVTALTQLHRIFLLLRFNALLFALGTLILLYKISKDELRTNPLLAVILFATTPVWIYWSTYYKYDVGVTFWIVFTTYILLYYKRHNTRKIYWLSGIISALAVSTKISALPVIPLYILAFFLFAHKPIKQLPTLIFGLAIFCLTFCVAGIPDVLLLRTNWGDYLAANLTQSNALIFGLPWYLYLLIHQYPLLFGYGLYFIFFISGVYSAIWLISVIRAKKLFKHKEIILLVCGLFFFSASLLSLKAGATIFRLFVILPFLILLSTVAVTNLLKKFSQIKLLLYLLLGFIIGLQIMQCYEFISVKYGSDPRVSSSTWISNHIKPASTIGLENIPIYQGIPNILLLDYYRESRGEKGIYEYQVIGSDSPHFPTYIVITNLASIQSDQMELQSSPKYALLKRLKKAGYLHIARFQSDESHLYFVNKQDYYQTDFTESSIDIYKK